MSDIDIKEEIIESSTEENESEDMLVSQLNVSIANQYVLFNVGDEEYGIPILSVQEIISMPTLTKIPGIPEYIPGIINLRGNIIPLYILRRKFHLPEQEDNEDNVVVILQINEKQLVGFIVDAVSDVASITEENLKEPPDFVGAANTEFVEKIGHLGNRMIIILSIDSFFTEKETTAFKKAISKASTV